jgi:hypothetical protein
VLHSPTRSAVQNGWHRPLPAADEKLLKDMDGGAELTTNEAKGRNNWIV